jgi:hypothetical protein
MNEAAGFDLPTHNSFQVPSNNTFNSRDKPTAYQDEDLRYLQSARWRTLSRAVRMRARGKCEISLRANGEETAHLTYERIFNERMTDLLWVCKRCHRELDNSLGFGG